MKKVMFKSIKDCAVISQQSVKKDNGLAQDDFESKDFEGENGKGGLDENKGQVVIYRLFFFLISMLFNIDNFAHLAS